MNNEIEQIAQQNDMSIEFVRWFFNEKKADCGEQWFLALGAMWEGWKAREGEVTALALTLEKSREASGCPADVDLQDWVKQLAAENVGMKEALWWLYEVVSSDCVFIPDEKYSSVTNAAHVLLEIHATDRILAEAEARGIEMGIAHLENKFNSIGVQIMNLQWLADSLREGADK
ncbi:hypothetical protein [Klebsiella aerogenes]|uniref:hypothetical protein n=1 Tax=Klebsiella aerogenes TaxID=548 RepID=UPI001918F33E|nr:hypothetical protein [Klebsiella aerogenes]